MSAKIHFPLCKRLIFNRKRQSNRSKRIVPKIRQFPTRDGSFGVSNNQFGFNVTGTANIPIVVEACTNLASPVWTVLRSLKLTNGSFYFSDPQWTNYSGRFYRISSP